MIRINDTVYINTFLNLFTPKDSTDYDIFSSSMFFEHIIDMPWFKGNIVLLKDGDKSYYDDSSTYNKIYDNPLSVTSSIFYKSENGSIKVMYLPADISKCIGVRNYGIYLNGELYIYTNIVIIFGDKDKIAKRLIEYLSDTFLLTPIANYVKCIDTVKTPYGSFVDNCPFNVFFNNYNRYMNNRLCFRYNPKSITDNYLLVDHLVYEAHIPFTPKYILNNSIPIYSLLEYMYICDTLVFAFLLTVKYDDCDENGFDTEYSIADINNKRDVFNFYDKMRSSEFKTFSNFSRKRASGKGSEINNPLVAIENIIESSKTATSIFIIPEVVYDTALFSAIPIECTLIDYYIYNELLEERG